MEKRLSQKKLSDLRKFQVHKLFVIYLNEQLSLEHLFNYSEDSESYYERRKNILLDFRQKMRELERKKLPEGSNEEDIDAELDALLNS